MGIHATQVHRWPSRVAQPNALEPPRIDVPSLTLTDQRVIFSYIMRDRRAKDFILAISGDSPPSFSGDCRLSNSEITAGWVFTSHVALACCTLWRLEWCSSAAHALPCGSKHIGSEDSQAMPLAFEHRPLIFQSSPLPRKVPRFTAKPPLRLADCQLPK